MDTKVKIISVTMRILLGWYMLVAGWPKAIDPTWSASGFLTGAKTFNGFYSWFALPMNAWWVNPLNAWGLVLIGVALILGVGVRLAAWGGAIIMILYYFPHYVFPYVDHGYIVEYHIIFALAFALIAVFAPAQEFGIAGYLRKTFLGRIPVIKSLI